MAWAFCGCINLSDISLPKSLTELENAETIFDGCNLETISIDPDNKHFIVKGNCLLSNDEKRLIRGCNNSTIPESVRVIGMNAFKGCPNAEKKGLYNPFWDNFFDGIEREEKSIKK